MYSTTSELYFNFLFCSRVVRHVRSVLWALAKYTGSQDRRFFVFRWFLRCLNFTCLMTCRSSLTTSRRNCISSDGTGGYLVGRRSAFWFVRNTWGTWGFSSGFFCLIFKRKILTGIRNLRKCSNSWPCWKKVTAMDWKSESDDCRT